MGNYTKTAIDTFLETLELLASFILVVLIKMKSLDYNTKIIVRNKWLGELLIVLQPDL
jgi:hypothetical protein